MTRYWTLDLVRLWAAGLVMVFHLSWWSWVEPKSTPASVLQGAASFPAWTPYAWFGWVGVEIFFVISGFVIALSATHSNALRFLHRRYLRLFPGALVCASITVALLAAWGSMDIAQLAARYSRSIVLWPYGPWIDGVYWTLAVELAFYFIVSIAICIRRFVTIETIAIVLGCVSSALWFQDLALNGRLTGNLVAAISGRNEQLLLLQHGMHFALGTVIFSATLNGWTGKRIAFTTAFFISGCLPILEEAIKKVERYDLNQPFVVPVIVWALAVMAIAVFAKFERPLSDGATQVVGAVGRSTYPLYLLHDIPGAFVMLFLLGVGLPPISALVATIIFMVGFSILVCMNVEDKIRPLLDIRSFNARGRLEYRSAITLGQIRE